MLRNFQFWNTGNFVTRISQNYRTIIRVIFCINSSFNITNKRFTENVISLQHYDETNWNCYDFVLEFLLDFGLLKRTRNVKEIFVTEHVCKALQRVLRYYSLLNKLSHRDANYPTLSWTFFEIFEKRKKFFIVLNCYSPKVVVIFNDAVKGMLLSFCFRVSENMKYARIPSLLCMVIIR